MSEEVFMWPTFTGEDGSAREATKGEVVSAVYDLRALLAQRDAELEALRKVVRYAFNAAEGQKTDIDRYGFDDSSDETVIVIYTLLAAALSDNPESPALTDKE